MVSMRVEMALEVGRRVYIDSDGRVGCSTKDINASLRTGFVIE
jgi:hypothetical protein